MKSSNLISTSVLARLPKKFQDASEGGAAALELRACIPSRRRQTCAAARVLRERSSPCRSKLRFQAERSSPANRCPPSKRRCCKDAPDKSDDESARAIR